MLSRTITTPDSLSGDDDRSGDSGDDRGGVSNGSAPAKAASTRFTSSFEDLRRGKNKINQSVRETVEYFLLHPINRIKLIFIKQNSPKISCGIVRVRRLHPDRSQQSIWSHDIQRLVEEQRVGIARRMNLLFHRLLVVGSRRG